MAALTHQNNTSSVSSLNVSRFLNFAVTKEEMDRHHVCSSLQRLRESVHQDEDLKANPKAISEKIEAQKELLPQDCQTAVVDSKLSKELAVVTKAYVDSIDSERNPFQVGDFVIKIGSHVGASIGNDGNFILSSEQLIKFGQSVCRYPASLNYLCGSFGLNTVTTKHPTNSPKTKTSKRLKDPPRDAPTKVTKALRSKEKSKDSVDFLINETLEQFQKYCKRNRVQKLGFYEFVINPMSFGLTVENIFHVSFLIQQKKLFMLKKENDKHELHLPDSPTVRKGRVDQESGQMLLSLDMAKWRQIIDTLNLPMVPMISHVCDDKDDDMIGNSDSD